MAAAGVSKLEDATDTAVVEESAQGAWFLYLIECRDGSLYAGITTDVAARYAVHLSGKGARYTRSHPPVRLVGSVSYPDRSSASKAEYRIKQLKPAAKRAFIAAAFVQSDQSNKPG